VTALGVNTGTAGAFVVNGGALGTPSSGTVTNLTGTASININGTVGATTANTGAFTTIVGTTTSATGFAVGRQGTTNPVLNVDASTASVVTGLNLKGAAAAGGMALSVTSSGTNENLTIDAKGSGTVTINATGTGSVLVNRLLDISASTAGQIKFPATQNASADANTLDDYEEGTWTPTYTDGTNNASGYLVQVGSYVKIGSLVTLGWYIRANGLGSMSGPVYVGGLTFTSKNTTNLAPAGSVGRWQIWTLGSTYSQLGLYLNNNDTKINITAMGSGLGYADATAAMMSSTALISGAISYTV
jgi:hypothetical protein